MKREMEKERYKSVSGLMHHVKVVSLHFSPFSSSFHRTNHQHYHQHDSSLRILFSPHLPLLIPTNLEQTHILDGPNEPRNNDRNCYNDSALH